LLPAQTAGPGGEQQAVAGILSGGGGEHTLVYEDDEGDQMLVGDVPWQ
jgi:auxin-responsive protein IAA